MLSRVEHEKSFITSITTNNKYASTFIAYAQTPPLKYSAGLGLNFGLSLHLHPYIVYASNEGPRKYDHLCTLTQVFAAQQCDKYQISCAGSNMT